MNHYGEELTLQFCKYANGNNAITLADTQGEMYATASVNVPGVELESNEVLIKNYSENEGILEMLEEAGYVERTGRYVQSGFVNIPICKIIKHEV
jgi:hypothetical protein